MGDYSDILGLSGLIVLVVGSFYALFFSKASSRPLIAPPEQAPKEEAKKAKAPEPKPLEKPWSERLREGLAKTRGEVWGRVAGLLGKGSLGAEEIEQIEEILYTSDLAPAMIEELLERLKRERRQEEEDQNFLPIIKSFLKEKMEAAQADTSESLYRLTESMEKPQVIMIVGVNGAGKTTTIGKLATRLKSQGAKVVVGACDTFRAAAVEQLEVWCQRAGVDIVKAAEGASPSGVAYEAVERAVKEKADYCIIDTAGRLHTAANLMEELAKTKRVMSKVLPSAPQEVLLVVDAITGQNALRQADEFNKTLDLTGLIFTKCDGSSKAGSAVGIVNQLKVPVAYIGVGENVEDLDRFDLDEYLDALLGIESQA